MTLVLRREGFEYEVLVLQRLLDENRSAYINALHTADEGDLTEWVMFLAKALHDAVVETARLKYS